MGQFSVKVGVAHPAKPEIQIPVELLVDTGATLSWIPREVIEQIGAPRLRRKPFVLADGRTIERETAGVLMTFDGGDATVTVVVAEPGEALLLGATSLETLGFGVDPINLRLVPRALLAM